MRRSCRSPGRALLLLIAFAAFDVLAERATVRSIRLEVKVEVPGYTSRWQATGQLAALERDLHNRILQRFQNHFAFLEWVESRDIQPTLLLAVLEDSNSPRKPGLRPWVLVATLNGIPRGAPIRICDAQDVPKRLPRNDLAKAAHGLVDLVLRRLPLHEKGDQEAWQRAFVKETLSGVSVADDIAAHGLDAVTLNVPYAELHASHNSTMEAVFKAHPKAYVDRTVRLELAPVDEREDGRTECDIKRNLVTFQTAEQRRQYIVNRTVPIIVGMTFYELQRGPRRVHDETTAVRP